MRSGQNQLPTPIFVTPSNKQIGFEIIADMEPVNAKTRMMVKNCRFDDTPQRFFNFSISLYCYLPKSLPNIPPIPPEFLLTASIASLKSTLPSAF